MIRLAFTGFAAHISLPSILFFSFFRNASLLFQILVRERTQTFKRHHVCLHQIHRARRQIDREWTSFFFSSSSCPMLLYNLRCYKFMFDFQLVSGTKNYIRPLSSAVVNHSQSIQQNQTQNPVSAVSLLSIFSRIA